PHLHGFDDLGHPDRVDFIPRLHRLLFQVEKDLRKPRLLLGEREYGLVDYLQPEGGLDTLAPLIGDVEPDARLFTRALRGSIGSRLDLQFVGGLYEDEPVVGYRLRVASEEIRMEVQRAGKFRRRGERQLRLPVDQVEIARENGLAFLDNIYIRRAAFFGREH